MKRSVFLALFAILFAGCVVVPAPPPAYYAPNVYVQPAPTYYYSPVVPYYWGPSIYFGGGHRGGRR